MPSEPDSCLGTGPSKKRKVGMPKKERVGKVGIRKGRDVQKGEGREGSREGKRWETVG